MRRLMLIALFSVFVLSSCKSDDGPSCETKINRVADALQAYVDDIESSEKCNDYKDALENSLGCYGTEEAEADAQAAVDNLDCE